MIVRVTMKTPDALLDEIDRAVARELSQLDVAEDEKEILAESRAGKVNAIIVDNWMKWGEYLTVDFDTEALTARVVTCKELR